MRIVWLIGKRKSICQLTNVRNVTVFLQDCFIMWLMFSTDHNRLMKLMCGYTIIHFWWRINVLIFIVSLNFYCVFEPTHSRRSFSWNLCSQMSLSSAFEVHELTNQPANVRMCERNFIQPPMCMLRATHHRLNKRHGDRTRQKKKWRKRNPIVLFQYNTQSVHYSQHFRVALHT